MVFCSSGWAARVEDFGINRRAWVDEIKVGLGLEGLVSPVRRPSPLGWAGMIRAFGASPIRRRPHAKTHTRDFSEIEIRSAPKAPAFSALDVPAET